jgi:hypothetical protein
MAGCKSARPSRQTPQPRSDVWRASLTKLRPKFEAEGLKYPELRCVAVRCPFQNARGVLERLLEAARTFEAVWGTGDRSWVGKRSSWGVPPIRTAGADADPSGRHRRSRNQPPKAGRFPKSTGPAQPVPDLDVVTVAYCGGDPATQVRFQELAKRAGGVLATMPARARQVLPRPCDEWQLPPRREMGQTVWLAALWCLAWDPRPGALLGAGRHHAPGSPDGTFYSVMNLDPFSASVELIDALLGPDDGSGAKPPGPAKPPGVGPAEPPRPARAGGAARAAAGRGPTTNALVMAALSSDASRHWTVRALHQATGRSIASISGTPAWKAYRLSNHATRLERAERQSRSLPRQPRRG